MAKYSSARLVHWNVNFVGYFRVVFLEFVPGFLGGKLPGDRSSLLIPVLLPGSSFPGKRVPIGDAPIQTLLAKRGKLYLRHIEPIGMGGV